MRVRSDSLFLKKLESEPFRSIPKIVGTHTFRKFFLIFLRRTHVK
ncbi:hypothetical protein LEP1GSC021_2184 [Leptospira noguchii str. 1993005606]|nr:hypothetical protein LEP1GSC021_2184 [Leptospira noguchii str. 1993005606]